MPAPDGYLGFVKLGDTVNFKVQTRATTDVPTNADAAPRRQVYGPTGSVLAAPAGQASQSHTGTVTGATNATPIVITTVAHGLQTGARVTVINVGGNTNANTTTTVTRVDADTFQLDGTVGNGAYTTGGTWNVSGLYDHSIAVTAGNGFASGNLYFILSTWAISTARSQINSFNVW